MTFDTFCEEGVSWLGASEIGLRAVLKTSHGMPRLLRRPISLGIGLANLLEVVLHHQASANTSRLIGMRQPSGAVFLRRSSAQAWYSGSGSAKRQDGISAFSRRASTPLRQVLTEFIEFFCVTGSTSRSSGGLKRPPGTGPTNSGHEVLRSKAVRPGRQALVEPQIGFQDARRLRLGGRTRPGKPAGDLPSASTSLLATGSTGSSEACDDEPELSSCSDSGNLSRPFHMFSHVF